MDNPAMSFSEGDLPVAYTPALSSRCVFDDHLDFSVSLAVCVYVCVYVQPRVAAVVPV